MTHFLKEWEQASLENVRAVAEESFILEVTESICAFLERKGMTRAELARSMGKKRAFITQVLDGSRNMTLRTLADIAFALDVNPRDLIEHSEDWETFKVGFVVQPDTLAVAGEETGWSAPNVIRMPERKTAKAA